MKTLILSQFVGPMIRHGLTVVGGYLLAEGVADQAAVDAITGGAVALAGVGMSFWDKKSRI
tara:strand:+ start:2600 stop:2782 length:183 start_codon:yes stop_codon:yes gene_type:complete